MWDTSQCMHFIGLKNSNPDNLFFGFDDQLRSICRNAQMTLVGQFIVALSLVLQVRQAAISPIGTNVEAV